VLQNYISKYDKFLVDRTDALKVLEDAKSANDGTGKCVDWSRN